MASVCSLGTAPSYAAATDPSATVDERGMLLQAVLTQSGTFDTNPMMLTQGAKSLYGSVTSPELIFMDNTPITKITVDTTVNESLFNQSNFNSTDFHSKAGFATQGSVWGFGLKEVTDRDTTRTSELSPSFGLTIKPFRHTKFELIPDVSYAPTSVDKFDVTGSVSRSIYSSPIYTNYNVVSVTPSYQHSYSELNAATFSINAQRYMATNGGKNSIDSVSPSVGWISHLTPRLVAQGSVGVQSSREYGTSVDAKAWGLDYTFMADIAFKGEQDTASLTASRSEYPFGNGTESLLTTISAQETHELSPHFAFVVGLNYQSASYPVDATGNLQKQYGGNSGLIFHATDTVDFSANYQYRHETLINNPTAAEDHSASINLIFHPRSWAM